MLNATYSHRLEEVEMSLARAWVQPPGSLQAQPAGWQRDKVSGGAEQVPTWLQSR